MNTNKPALSSNALGTLQVALGATAWSFCGVLAKWVPWNSMTLHGLRMLFGAMFMLLMRRSCRVHFSLGTVLGALGTTMTAMLYIVAVKLTTAANAIVLQYAMPVFVIAFLWIFHGQRPSRADVVTTAFILLGIVLCSAEGLSGGNLWGDLLALLSAVTFSLVFFCSRMPNTKPTDYTFLGHVLGAPFALCAFFDPAVTAAPAHWLAIIAMAFCLSLGYYLMSLGMTRTSPISAALLSNLEPILNPFWVFLLLGEQPGPLTLAGAAIVLAAATMYTILGHRRRER
ncbi:MAG: EamA family transporter [Clostridia bacterium]|nr:EamA family transporter [Clostridia bacterium]